MTVRRPPGPTHRQCGFTALEFVVVLAVLVSLSALLIPAISTVLDDSKVRDVADLYRSLRPACARHHHDTDRFAHEYTGPSFKSDGHHELSREQVYPGWKGSYLRTGLSLESNPWGGNVHLYNYLLVNGAKGWDLDADGRYEHREQGRACVLWMDAVPEESAILLDEALDSQGSRDAGWRRSGRIQWRNGSLWMLVHHELEGPTSPSTTPRTPGH